MQKGDDKLEKKLLIQKKGKEKKRAIEKDRNRFANKKSKFWLVRMREKQKRCLITRLVGKYAFV